MKKSLKYLSLPTNNLSTVPDEVFELTNLNRLDLSQNFIETVRDLAQAENLEYLDLSRNNISDINSVTLPNSLKTLVLTNNRLTLQGIKTFNLNKLKELNLSYNMLSGTLNQESFLNSKVFLKLNTLDLSFNKLESLGFQPLAKFPKLKILKLKSNTLQILNPMAFQGLTRLKTLDLSSNAILDLPNSVFKNLSTLESLDLSQNHLQSISGSFTDGLSKLSTLNLGNNDIIFLEPLQDVSEHLTYLSLKSNPLDCVCTLKPFQVCFNTLKFIFFSNRGNLSSLINFNASGPYRI